MDQHGKGKAVDVPIKIKTVLSWSPVQHIAHRYPVEKLHITFVKKHDTYIIHILFSSLPLGLFSGRLHQVLCLLFLPKLVIFTTIEILLPYLCLS